MEGRGNKVLIGAAFDNETLVFDFGSDPKAVMKFGKTISGGFRKHYKTLSLFWNQKEVEAMKEVFENYLGTSDGIILIDLEKEGGIRSVWEEGIEERAITRHFKEVWGGEIRSDFFIDSKKIILSFGKGQESGIIDRIDRSDLVRAPRFKEFLAYSISSISKILPSEVEKEININLPEEEFSDIIMGSHRGIGINCESIASKEDINAAKAEITKAIEEIAEKEHVELKNKTKEELANLSIILLGKIGEGV